MDPRDIRDRLLRAFVDESVSAYVERDPDKPAVRRCAWCHAKFQPHQRWHFFCCYDHRRAWYSGQFRPRTPVDVVTRKRRTA
jgi:hypothetical protein